MARPVVEETLAFPLTVTFWLVAPVEVEEVLIALPLPEETWAVPVTVIVALAALEVALIVLPVVVETVPAFTVTEEVSPVTWIAIPLVAEIVPPFTTTDAFATVSGFVVAELMAVPVPVVETTPLSIVAFESDPTRFIARPLMAVTVPPSTRTLPDVWRAYPAFDVDATIPPVIATLSPIPPFIWIAGFKLLPAALDTVPPLTVTIESLPDEYIALWV